MIKITYNNSEHLMIPLDIGKPLGTSFGSSDELTRIKEINDANYKSFKSYHESNPKVYQADTLFVRLINIVRSYSRRGLRIEVLMPNIAMHLNLVYRNYNQVLHSTDWGKLLIIPIYDNSPDMFKVVYSDSEDLNYNNEALIKSHSFVTINIKLLEKTISTYNKRGKGMNELITNEISIPLTKGIIDQGMLNIITSIDKLKYSGKPNHPFYMNDLNKFVYGNRKRISSAVNGLETNPLDVLSNLPLSNPLEYNLIEDMYIDNLLWINLMSFKNLISRCESINSESMYEKFYSSYKLYSPRGRGDKYFMGASSEILDHLEDAKFI